MGITSEEARLIALSRIGLDLVLNETETLERPYGWYFAVGARQLPGAGDDHEIGVGGSCGFVVEREDGRVFEFGSAFAPEKWLENYVKGFKYERYDLTIHSVADIETTVDCLARLSMTYVVPEYEHGTLWKIPREFTRQQIEARLNQLPCRFRNQAFWHRVEVLDRI